VTDCMTAFAWIFTAERREEVLAIVKLVLFVSV
jgi:hypothetical protein